MATLSQFGRKMVRTGARVETNRTKIKKKVAVKVLTAVVNTTPHASGRARHSWNVNMDSPNYDFNYESFEGNTRASDWLPKLAMSTVAILRAGASNSIYISNGLPYIQRLNRGYSPQAPRDFVGISTRIGIRELNKSRILV